LLNDIVKFTINGNCRKINVPTWGTQLNADENANKTKVWWKAFLKIQINLTVLDERL